MNESSSEFGRRIYENVKHQAKKKGIMMSDLEKGAGISRGYLSRVGRGKRISIDAIYKIAKQLNVKLEYLFENEPQKED